MNVIEQPFWTLNVENVIWVQTPVGISLMGQGGGSVVPWGNITGSIDNQSDLFTYIQAQGNFFEVDASLPAITGKRFTSYADAVTYIQANFTPGFFERFAVRIYGTMAENSPVLEPWIYPMGFDGDTALISAGNWTNAGTGAVSHSDAYQMFNLSTGGVDPDAGTTIRVVDCKLNDQEATVGTGTMWLVGSQMFDGDNNADVSSCSMILEAGSVATIQDGGDIIIYDAFLLVKGTTIKSLQTYSPGAQVFFGANTTITDFIFLFSSEIYGSDLSLFNLMNVDLVAETFSGELLHDLIKGSTTIPSLLTTRTLTIAGGTGNQIENSIIYDMNIVVDGATTVVETVGSMFGLGTETITTANGGTHTIRGDIGALVVGADHSDLTLNDGTNPHGTTKADVGLGNVDNTSDADKPVSTAQQTALDLKLDLAGGTMSGAIAMGANSISEILNLGLSGNIYNTDLTNIIIELIDNIDGVNHVSIENAIAGVAPGMEPIGPDSNIDLLLNGKGTGRVRVSSSGLQVIGDTIIGSNITPDGTLHVHSGSAGVIGPTSSADDLIVENSADAGITILSPDVNISALNLGSPNRQTGAFLRWQNSTQIFNIGTGDTNGIITFDTALSIEAMRIDDNQNIIMGGTSADASAKLQIDSTTQGLLKPRLTTPQRDAIVSPATGLEIYHSSFDRPEWFDGNNWVIGTEGKTVTVGKSNADYKGLTDALADSIITGATSSNPVAIHIYSGIYEVADFTIPSFVFILALGDVILRPIATTTSVFCTLSANSMLEDIVIEGNNLAGGVGAIGVQVSGGTIASIINITVRDFHIGYVSTGAGSTLLGDKCRAEIGANTDMNTGFSSILDGGMTLVEPIAIGTFATRMPIGYIADGTGSTITSIGGSCIFGTQAVIVDDLGEITANSLSISQCDEGLVMLDNGGATTLRALNVSISSTVDIHHNLEDNNVGAFFMMSGGRFDASKVIHSSTVTILTAAASEEENEASFRILAEINQGSPARPSEAHFASGDSSTIGMTVKTNTNGEIGTWADVTTAAASASASTVTMFPGVTAENAIYFGRGIQFEGFKLNDLSTLMVIGAGAVDFEFWNGAAWIDVDIMESDSDDLEDVRANVVFQTNINGDLNIRLGDLTGWATKALDGTTAFWLRIRITTAITTAPVFQQSRLHANSFQVNNNGLLQKFGEGRELILIGFPRQEDLTGFGAANSSIDANTNTNIGLQNNNRAPNAKDGSGVILILPAGIDTSKGVEVILNWAQNGAGTGDVENSVSLSSYREGDVLDGTIPEITKDVITSVDNQPDEDQSASFFFSIESSLPGDNFNIGQFRDATAGNLNDTLSNPTYLISVQIILTEWR